MLPHTSYLVCATPRSGSTLLCEALNNTGLAGHPQEYFEALKETGLPRRPQQYFDCAAHSDILDLLGTYSRLDDQLPYHNADERTNYARYLVRALEKGTTSNGVFGSKMMWGYFGDFISNLRDIPEYREMPVPDLLSTIFPNLHYIWIIRDDKVRQAVSLWKAIQTSTWRVEACPSSIEKSSPADRKLVFHFGAIDHLRQQIIAHEDAWQQYFNACGIQPFYVVYEEFVASYEDTARCVLQYLHIPLPEKLMVAERRMTRQADGLSEEWVQQYHAIEQGERKAVEVSLYSDSEHR
jgi:trehalose 2-sulfotransferase